MIWSNAEMFVYEWNCLMCAKTMWKRNVRFSWFVFNLSVNRRKNHRALQMKENLNVRWMCVCFCVSDNHEFMVLVRLKFRGCLFRTRFHSSSLSSSSSFSIVVSASMCVSVSQHVRTFLQSTNWHWILLQYRCLTVTILIFVECSLTSVFNLVVAIWL